MIDQNFSEFLEYEINKALGHLATEEIKGFWCDGVLLVEPDLNKQIISVNDDKIEVGLVNKGTAFLNAVPYSVW